MELFLLDQRFFVVCVQCIQKYLAIESSKYSIWSCEVVKLGFVYSIQAIAEAAIKMFCQYGVIVFTCCESRSRCIMPTNSV